ncbi:zf-TFIIB domain-containing protein [Myxococcota bacterium]|nr:zf-TFIIB domain-containing protein [Myxococcota bacterium]
MKCPRCTEELQATSLRELGIVNDAYACNSCEGLWIERSQLDEMERSTEQVFFEIRAIPSDELQRVPLSCPSCEGVLMEKKISQRDDKVVFDVCPKCQRIWLDGGERRAIEREGFAALISDFLTLRTTP